MDKKTKINETKEELSAINKEIYERNLELSIRNKTLSTLQIMYEIINTSQGLEITADNLLKAIVNELNFFGGIISLVDKKRTKVVIISAHCVQKDDCMINKIINKSIPITNNDNFQVSCVNTGNTRMSNNLYEILCPVISQKEADQIQAEHNITTFVVYPIKFGGQIFGSFTVILGKHIGSLSRAEKETLKELVEVIGIAIDRAKLLVDLKKANIRLKELDKLKDDFVSVASHELRTPMTAIKSYLWMALEGRGGDINQKQKFYLDRAYNSTDRLIKLVNDMLNISRIESGRMSFNMKRINIISLVEEVVDEVKPRAEELKITIHVICNTIHKNDDTNTREQSIKNKLEQLSTNSDQILPDNTKFTNSTNSPKIPDVLCDPDKIKEVLFNLIGNSLKFTAEKTGVIDIKFTIEKNHNQMVRISVADNGQGIDKEDLDKLFTKFGMIEGSYATNKKASGTGLGLYISKSIIEVHGGKILAESAGIGKGSTFSFTLPVYSKNLEDKMNKMFKGTQNLGIIHTKI